MESNELEVFYQKELYGCWILLIIGITFILLFFNDSYLIIFLLGVTLRTIVFLWDYKYRFQIKPVIIINEKHLKYKNTIYNWQNIKNLVCIEEYDEERSQYDAVYIKFEYKNLRSKIYISGLTKPIDIIIKHIGKNIKK